MLLEKLPLFGLAAAVSITTFAAQKQAGAMTAIPVALSERLANAVVSYVRYLGKMVWPNPLTVLYPYDRELSPALLLFCLALLGSITALALYFGRTRRYLPVGWFWFLGTMVPMVGIVQVGWQSYADRYSYIPGIGVLIAVVWLAADLSEGREWERFVPVPAAAILAALAILTWRQLPYWHDDVTLFEHTIASTAGNPAAEYHLAGDFVDQNLFNEAMPHLEKMIRLRPDFYAAYYLLGKSQAATGNPGAATRNFTEALRWKPDYAEAYFARGTMLIQGGNGPAAEQDFRAALKHDLSAEWTPLAHDSLGVIEAQRGDFPHAIADFEWAVGARPELVGPQRNLANALAAQGRLSDAIAALEKALSATRGDPAIRQMLDQLRARS